MVFANLLSIKHARVYNELLTFIHFKQFKAFMKRNLVIFKIPPQALEDPELSNFIDSLMKDVLTKQWSTIKIKIATAINTQMHISYLTKSLALSGYYEVTTDQWTCFALLAFNNLMNKSMEDKVVILKLKRDNSQ
ncbi:hypothetical protein EV363DRAFT_1448555 [Boletus edulis]|nr:hypothetical protein EV363DRAFT_1448555 [Boletus edulis]